MPDIFGPGHSVGPRAGPSRLCGFAYNGLQYETDAMDCISSLIKIFCSCQPHTVCTCMMIRFIRSIDRFVQTTAPSSSVAVSNCTLI